MRYQINLLQEKEKDISGKIIYFALHYLRYILVLTQIVVIAVFFYRFRIDQEVIDLRDELMQKEEIVEVSNSLLQEASGVDIKTREIRDILVKQDSFQQMYAYFLSVFPSDLSIDRLQITENSMEFEAVTGNPAIVKNFLARLNSDKAFATIELGSIRREESQFRCPFRMKGFIPKK